MKKLLLSAMLISLVATSCSDDDNNTPNTRNLSGEIPAVVIPANTAEEAVLTELPIKITQYMDEGGIWRINVNSFTLPSGEKLSFMSPDIAGSMNDFINPDIMLRCMSNFMAETGQTIRNLNVDLINNYYYLSFSGEGSVSPYGTYVAANFKVGSDYSIATFPREAYYGGTTITKYNIGSGDKEFRNEVPMYFFNIDMSRRTAILTIYNAKFAEEMPMALSAVTLRGLKVEPSSQSGYRISGKNIVPVVGVGGNEVEYPQYTFDDIEMHPTNTALTQCEINYSVAGRFAGRFTGSYTVSAQ